MKTIRFRTEAFSGLQERDAAEVMAFETFELGNTDILQTLAEGILKDRGSITTRCCDFIDELQNNGFVDDMSTDDQISFMKGVLAEIEQVTGVKVLYALWLADKEAVTSREWYGRDMADETDFECYEIGPVVLSELGYDGTLYGYEEMPICLENRIERLRDEFADMNHQRAHKDLSPIELARLDERQHTLSAEVNPHTTVMK